jgi:HSP20 family molecular chaperone IbpA
MSRKNEDIFGLFNDMFGDIFFKDGKNFAYNYKRTTDDSIESTDGIVKDKDGFTITVLVPGMKAQDIAVQIDGRTTGIWDKLRIQGKKGVRTISRSLDVIGCDPSRATAEVEDGILTIKIPFLADKSNKSVSIHVTQK